MRPEKFPNKHLIFQCQQDIEVMQGIEGGKHCQLCNKAVIDFRQKTHQQFLNITNGKEHYCGIYYEEQVEDIYPINIDFRKPFLVAASIGVLIGLTNIPAFSQENSNFKTEQLPVDTSKTQVSITTTDTTKKKCNETLEHVKQHKIFETRRRIVYFSKRFPFIKSRKRMVLMGF